MKVGLVTSISRPGGNITGVTFLATQIVGKRLELLGEMIPNARAIAVLVNPTNPDWAKMSRDLEQAERTVKFPLKIFHASDESEIDTEPFPNRAFLARTRMHTRARNHEEFLPCIRGNGRAAAAWGKGAAIIGSDAFRRSPPIPINSLSRTR